MTLANVKTFLEMSGADREAGDIVSAAGIDLTSDPPPEQGYSRYVLCRPWPLPCVSRKSRREVHHERRASYPRLVAPETLLSCRLLM